MKHLGETQSLFLASEMLRHQDKWSDSKLSLILLCWVMFIAELGNNLIFLIFRCVYYNVQDMHGVFQLSGSFLPVIKLLDAKNFHIFLKLRIFAYKNNCVIIPQGFETQRLMYQKLKTTHVAILNIKVSPVFFSFHLGHTGSFLSCLHFLISHISKYTSVPPSFFFFCAKLCLY